jgi:hypothetical protein
MAPKAQGEVFEAKRHTKKWAQHAARKRQSAPLQPKVGAARSTEAPKRAPSAALGVGGRAGPHKTAPVACAFSRALLAALGCRKQPEKAATVNQAGRWRWAALRGYKKTETGGTPRSK